MKSRGSGLSSKRNVSITIITFKNKKNVPKFVLLILWSILLLKRNFLIKTALMSPSTKLLQFIVERGVRNIVSNKSDTIGMYATEETVIKRQK